MSYPTIPELLDRDERNMSWTEYAEYIYEKTPVSNQQAHVLVGRAYGVPDKEIAAVCDTSTSVVASQRNKLTVRKEDGFTGTVRKEFVEPIYPATRFRELGSIEYGLLSDETPIEGDVGTVQLFIAVDGADYVWVQEEYRTTLEPVDDFLENSHFKEIVETSLYEDWASFCSKSAYSPGEVDSSEQGVEVSDELRKVWSV